MLSEHLSAQLVLFLILYGITGAAAFIAALYLLLRRGNAFAADVTPPLPLRRWAASFFAVSALGHVWWCVFHLLSVQHLFSDDLFCSVGYVAIVMLDCVTLHITYPPFPKREIYQFTDLPFYHFNNPPLLFNTRALLSNKRPLLNKSCSFHIEVIFNSIISPIHLQFNSNSIPIQLQFNSNYRIRDIIEKEWS